MDLPKILSGQHHARAKGNKSPTLRSGIVSINIPAGKDVVQWLFQLCCRSKVSLTVSEGSGQLSNVILRGQQRPIVGPFRMESLSGYVTFNSPERVFPFQVTLGGPDGRLYTRMAVGGTASTTVEVVAMMTVLQDLENASSSGNSSSRIMNVQSSECYKPVTPHHHPNVPIRLENGTDEEHNLMNSVHGESMATLQRERVMAAGMRSVMNKTTTTTSKLNKKASSSIHNQKDVEDNLTMMKSKNDELVDDFWNSLSPIVDLSPFEGV